MTRSLSPVCFVWAPWELAAMPPATAIATPAARATQIRLDMLPPEHSFYLLCGRDRANVRRIREKVKSFGLLPSPTICGPARAAERVLQAVGSTTRSARLLGGGAHRVSCRAIPGRSCGGTP